VGLVPARTVVIDHEAQAGALDAQANPDRGPLRVLARVVHRLQAAEVHRRLDVVGELAVHAARIHRDRRLPGRQLLVQRPDEPHLGQQRRRDTHGGLGEDRLGHVDLVDELFEPGPRLVELGRGHLVLDQAEGEP
jgi:hypothetical protein